MADNDTQASIAQWLQEKGYSEAEISKILVRLAAHDHETLSDAVFDSIGNGGKTLDQIIADVLRE